MKQPNVNNQSSVNETLHAQNGQELPASILNDLPVNEAQQAEVKGGVVVLEYMVIGYPGIAPPPTPTSLAPRP